MVSVDELEKELEKLSRVKMKDKPARRSPEKREKEEDDSEEEESEDDEESKSKD